jgi:thiol-disulfide isomerase/thioredoxin
MATRAKTVIRGSILVVAAVIVGAAFIRPFAVPPQARAVASEVATTGRVRATPSGLFGIDSRALLAHVHRSPARGVVVNAWASWCGSCKGDIPLLLGLPKTFGTSIEVLLVSVDEPESQADAMRMLHDFGASLPGYVVDEPLDAFKLAMNPRWPGMLPATFLFDTSGKLRYFWGGPILENDVLPLLRRYLAGEPIDGEANFALAPGKVTR